VPNEKRELPSWLNAKRGKPVLIGMPAGNLSFCSINIHYTWDNLDIL